jgi:hypothetical protein
MGRMSSSPDPTEVPDAGVAGLLDAFDRQAAWCEPVAPFTAAVLRRSRQWLAGDPAVAAAFLNAHPHPRAAATALRWAGALHHLALQGQEPWRSLWPPGAAGASGPMAAPDARIDAALHAAWTTCREAIDAALRHPPQTNEVMRSATLLPGLLWIAQATGTPLSLWELGSSAGLNLFADRYAHDHAGWTWPGAGGEDVPVLQADWTGALPHDLRPVPLQVVARHGGDLAPIDLRDPAEAVRLASFVWADQTDRLQRLRAAVAAARRWMDDEGVQVEARDAENFVAQMLSDHARRSDSAAVPVTTVLMHSVVWQYLPRATQQAVREAMTAAGARATPAAPLAWLTMEPPAADLGTRLRVTVWPSGRTVELAHGHPHGRSLHWAAAPQEVPEGPVPVSDPGGGA